MEKATGEEQTDGLKEEVVLVRKERTHKAKVCNDYKP